MTRTYAHGGHSWAQPTYRKTQPAPIAPPPRRPFSKSKTELQPGSGSTLTTAQIIQFPSTIKPEAEDKLPPMPAHRLISRPEPAMSDAAIRLFKLKAWFEICINDRQFDSEVYVTECRIREQAAHIIGFLA